MFTPTWTPRLLTVYASTDGRVIPLLTDLGLHIRLIAAGGRWLLTPIENVRRTIYVAPNDVYACWWLNTHGVRREEDLC